MALALTVGLALGLACAGDPRPSDAGDTALPVPCNGACTGVCQGLCVGICSDRNDAGTCSTGCEGTCIGTCVGSCPSRIDAGAGDSGDARTDARFLDTRPPDTRTDAPPDAPPADTAPPFEPGPPEAYGSWTNQSRVNSASWPSLEDTGAMVFDTMRARAVMFGGWRTPSNYTWEWDSRRSTWTLMQQKDGVRPSPRFGHALAYDSRRGRVILHGGIDETGASNGETWEWDGAAEVWTRRARGRCRRAGDTPWPSTRAPVR